MECRDDKEDKKHIFDTLSDKEYICAPLPVVTNHKGNDESYGLWQRTI
jgi:hypothetical protein